MKNAKKNEGEGMTLRGFRTALWAYYKLRRSNIRAMKVLRKLKHKELKGIQEKSIHKAQEKLDVNLIGKFQKILMESKVVPETIKNAIIKSDTYLGDKKKFGIQLGNLRKFLRALRTSLLRIRRRVHKKKQRRYKPVAVVQAKASVDYKPPADKTPKKIEQGIIETPKTALIQRHDKTKKKRKYKKKNVCRSSVAITQEAKCFRSFWTYSNWT